MPGVWQAARWPHRWLSTPLAYVQSARKGTLERDYKSDVTPNFHLQAPGPSHREDDMYKVQCSPNQTLGPILFPFKDSCILLSHFLGECLQSLFTTATMTYGMLGCIKYVGQLSLLICVHVESGS